MIAYDAWWLPDGEKHLQEWMTITNQIVEGRLTYQYNKYLPARDFCRRRRRAVDVGAHVGLFSYWMARDFEHVECFEPREQHRECWRANMHERFNATLYAIALGRTAGDVGLQTAPTSSGDTAVDLSASGIPMKPLDDFAFDDVDFIKIDCEGYEAFVLEGALDTVKRCRPTIIVEQKPGHGQRFGRGEQDAVALLLGLGAQLRWQQHGDFVLTFSEA